jgi:multiple sugar transport system substrate-binding protein
MSVKRLALSAVALLIGMQVFAAPEEVTVLAYNQRDEASLAGQLYKDFTKDTGIKVTVLPIPGSTADYQKKVDISFASGDTTDIFFATNPIDYVKNVINGNALALDDLAKSAKLDLDASYGKYVNRYKGKVYGIPQSPTYWAVFYNKKIFDDAGVPYPKGYWTWDQFLATAKKLTNPSKKIYGVFTPGFDAYSYLLANQKGVDGYKADGSSNFDDPAFIDSVQFLADLGLKHKVMPSYLEADSKKLPAESFVQGNYAMCYTGSWLFSQLSDTAKYPRDWKWGITQIPVPDAKSKNNVGAISYVMINKNAKNAAAALKLADYFGKNIYKYTNEPPAVADFSKDDYNKLFKDIAAASGGSVTASDIYDAVIGNGLGFRPEKITGSVAAQYKAIILKEVAVTYIGQRSAADTCKEIKKQVDEVIKATAVK